MLLVHQDFLHFHDHEMTREDAHGELVGNHDSLRCVLFDLATELPLAGDFAEDVPHRDVDEAGNFTQNRALSSLSAARHAEQ